MAPPLMAVTFSGRGEIPPTGGDGGLKVQHLETKVLDPKAVEPASAWPDARAGRVSRFGEIPKPTVKVRMEESGKDWPRDGRCLMRTLAPALLARVP